MEYSLDFEIGVVDFRNIIRVIKDTYDYDFSDYSLTSLKRRIEMLIQAHNLKQADALIEKLKSDKNYFQTFLQEISIGSTEMFRDPSFWRFLRDDLLPLFVKEKYKIKIWFPSCITGEELYTLSIVLKENGWTNTTDIVATCLTDKIIDSIRGGILRGSKCEVSSDNYNRYQGNKKFADYCTLNGESATLDVSLIKNVSFIKQNINFDNSPQDVKLIICRNQLIYYTQTLHDRVLKIFYDSLLSSGYLALGTKEQVGPISSKYLRTINETESIYRKIPSSV